jgi:predicted CXXCH cytochrome family protein
MPLRFAFFSLALILLCSGAAAAEETKEERGSTLPRRCGVCHLDRIQDEPRGLFNFLSLRTSSAAGEDEMCYSCHNGPVRDSRRGIWSGLQHRSDGRFVEPGSGVRASCGNCHDPHVQTAGVTTFMRFRKNYSAHCLKCHPGRGRASSRNHPTSAGTGKDSGGKIPTCFSCHTVHRASGRSLIRQSTAVGLCASCHGDNPSVKGYGPGDDTHTTTKKGPLCTTCHAVHQAPQDNLLRGDAASGALCLDCHENHSSRDGARGNHPILSGRVGCLSCHRTHNAARMGENTVLLAQQPDLLDTLCRECHARDFPGEEEWGHPVGVEIGEQSRGRLSKLVRYGGVITGKSEVLCLSCHTSHGGVEDTAGLVVRPQALCLYCHSEQNSLAPGSASFGTHPISVRPERATVSPSFLASGGVTGPKGEIICLTCHTAHGGDKGLVLPRQEYSCTLCHTDKGKIRETPHGRLESAQGQGTAPAEGPCRSCHGSHGWKVAMEETGMGGSAIERVCWHCHGPNGTVPMRGYFGHILGVPPARGTGGRDLPLFWSDGRRIKKGIITCSTCHDVHGDSGEFSLRLEPGEKRSGLCLGCHPRQEAVAGTKHDIPLYFPGEKNRLNENASDTGTCGACHLAHSSGLGDSWAREINVDPTELGRLYPVCSTCHGEGSLAQGKTVTEKTHPLPEVVSGNPNMGAVDCDGCHNPHAWNPLDSGDKGDFFTPGDNTNSFLVSPSSGRSPLCLKCHTERVTVAGTKHDLTRAEGEVKEGHRPGLCETCHLSHGGQKLLMWAAPLKEVESHGSETCLQCHQDRKDGLLSASDHPIGVTPGAKASEEFPLYLPDGRKYFRGNVSCGTCHDPHTWSPVKGRPPSQEGNSATSFLRMEADGFSPLCFPCHADHAMVVGTDHDLRVTSAEAVNLDGSTTEESGVCGACHSVHGAGHQPFLWNREAGAGEDPQSRYCRGCHDEGAMEEAKAPERFEAHLVSYPGKGMISRLFTKRQAGPFGNSSSLALFNVEGEKKSRGYISCATCHDPHRWEAETSRSGTGIPLEGDQGNSFLKERSTFSVGSSFCKTCHKDDTLEMYRRYHTPAEPLPTKE